MSARERTPIVVLASGRGSNFEAIARSVARGRLAADIRAVLTDRAEAPVLAKAKALGIEARVIPAASSREGWDRSLLATLAGLEPRFLVLAGYMRIMTPVLLDAFRAERGGRTYHRVTNVHPSLLPAFPGVGSYAQAFRQGCQVAGVTVHLVDQGVDSGPICAQESFSIRGLQSSEAVEKVGLEVEHRLYPETLSWILQEDFELEAREGRTCVRQN